MQQKYKSLKQQSRWDFRVRVLFGRKGDLLHPVTQHPAALPSHRETPKGAPAVNIPAARKGRAWRSTWEVCGQARRRHTSLLLVYPFDCSMHRQNRLMATAH